GRGGAGGGGRMGGGHGRGGDPAPGALPGPARHRHVGPGHASGGDAASREGGGMTEDDFDVEKLRLRPEDIAAYVGKTGTAAPRARRQDQFTSVPWSWSDRLAAARHVGTYKFALHLLYQYWKNGGRPISLTNTFATNAGVSRRSKWRALGELERLKLIEVERRPRK